MSNPSSGSNPNSKLFIRSEVTAVIEFFTTVEDPSKQDKVKQLKRLNQIEDQPAVQKILVKELQRTTLQPNLQVITELLMELGTIEVLQEPLWELIQNPQTGDEVKDCANLILRQLGDESDPSLYLDYLDDPEGLISRETERMLEVASKNPEALIDFIDFIFSLPEGEQCNLVSSLQEDYPTEYLLNLVTPILLAQPPEPLTEMLLTYLGQTKSVKAAVFLSEYPVPEEAKLKRAYQKAISELKIAGVYREDQFEQYRNTKAEVHPLIAETSLYQCYSTLPDGIGNQGIIISRQKENKDVMMMSVAVNDIHGIMDCFGFYQLSEGDFQRIIDKFHEGASKIKAPLDYCVQRLLEAEKLNANHQFRIPYEYSCWRMMLGETNNQAETSIDILALCEQWANLDWYQETINLYQHPDFDTWFLEEGDHPVVTSVLESVITHLGTDVLATEQDPATFVMHMDVLAETLVRGLLQGEWRQWMIGRLMHAAYLLHHQPAKTFAALAATEAVRIQTMDASDALLPLTGFLRQYGRRCVEEDLLRLRATGKGAVHWEALINKVLTTWQAEQSAMMLPH